MRYRVAALANTSSIHGGRHLVAASPPVDSEIMEIYETGHQVAVFVNAINCLMNWS